MFEYLKNQLDALRAYFRRLKETLSRMVYWGWKMRNSYDFDAHTVYDMLHYKLDRIYTEMLNNSHCVWNSDPKNNLMRKLKEASILAKRISEDEYTIRAMDETDERFTYKRWFTPCVDRKDMWKFESTYEKTPERARLFYKGRDRIYTKMKQHEVKRFHMLLEKYLERWWD